MSSYQEWRAAGERLDNEASTVIKVDVPRTGAEPALLPVLRRLLLAFAARNPDIGYCQGLNFVAATILLYCEEETAFWIFCSVIENILHSEYYTAQMAGLRADLKLLESLIKEYLPLLYMHLSERGIDLSPIAMNWFLCLFANTLPPDLSHRVLDCLIHEGPKVLLRTSLAVLRIREKELLEAVDASVVDAYVLLRSPFGASADDAHLKGLAPAAREDLFGSSMYGTWLVGFTRAKMDSLRASHLQEVRQEDEGHAARRRALAASPKRYPPVPSKDGNELPAQALRRRSTLLIQQLPPPGSPLSTGVSSRAWAAPGAAAAWLASVTGHQVAVEESSMSCLGNA
eukprot:TRINITY_DN34266_c0_g1_i2.p1 TRINITY_DN34266_c0_g1~~TRINITY_DN34266_c0_g1_i2.p1  ORF type:complete len:343 (+),score=74.70 TRINITY_DN34266_c0_g1_i2:418-1446(+)